MIRLKPATAGDIAITRMTEESKRFFAAVVGGFIAATGSIIQLNAQGIDSQEAIGKIIGSEVMVGEASAEIHIGKIVAAIEKTSENIGTIRKVSNLSKVDIVLLADAGASQGGIPLELDAKVEEYRAEISQLRKELEGNAMLFHAIDSRQILPTQVLAVEFDGSGAAIIYVARRRRR